MNPILHVIMGGLGTLGFNILFHLRGKRLFLATMGGVLSWSVYLLLAPLFAGESVRYLLSAAVITIYGEVLARIEKTPTTTFLVPAIIPLIPGSALYYTMNFALNKQWADFIQQAFYTVQLAFSLAAGIITVTTVVRLATVWKQRAKTLQSVK